MTDSRDTWHVYETALFNALNTIRDELALLENVSPYRIISDAALVELATYLPQTQEEFKKISGFNAEKINRYEKYFRETIVQFCSRNGLTSRVHLKTPPRRDDFDTKHFSLDLFNRGYSIPEIAERRGLKTGTIETHLAHYVREGKLELERLIPQEKIVTILSAIGGDSSLTAIRKRLGSDYSYGEIRLVLAHRDFLRENQMNEVRHSVVS